MTFAGATIGGSIEVSFVHYLRWPENGYRDFTIDVRSDCILVVMAVVPLASQEFSFDGALDGHGPIYLMLDGDSMALIQPGYPREYGGQAAIEAAAVSAGPHTLGLLTPDGWTDDVPLEQWVDAARLVPESLGHITVASGSMMVLEVKVGNIVPAGDISFPVVDEDGEGEDKSERLPPMIFWRMETTSGSLTFNLDVACMVIVFAWNPYPGTDMELRFDGVYIEPAYNPSGDPAFIFAVSAGIGGHELYTGIDTHHASVLVFRVPHARLTYTDMTRETF